MAKLLARSAVSPVRRAFAPAPEPLPCVDEIVATTHPHEPVHCLRPQQLEATARTFIDGFPGTVLYAVKCNPDPRVLRALWRGGVRHFDCASLGEVSLVRQMFADAAIHFMHPVKARPAIREAWAQHGVRDFVFDSAVELDKILAETVGGEPAQRGLIVRLAVSNRAAAFDLSGKFGCEPGEAAHLLKEARPHAGRLGIAFHVGSQCLDPCAYAEAIAVAARVVRAAGVPVDVLDVGGGFPVSYPDATPPSLAAYFAEIDGALARHGLADRIEVWAEPGRALVAAGTSVVVEVQLRRGRDLYINDGVYGSLSDAGTPRFRFPCRLIRTDGRPARGRLDGFRLFGPTCDSADRMQGPFLLPDDVAEGDAIEIGQLGAYGATLRTGFNGFDRARLVEVSDPPLLATPGHPGAPAAEPRQPEPRRAEPRRAQARRSGTSRSAQTSRPRSPRSSSAVALSTLIAEDLR